MGFWLWLLPLKSQKPTKEISFHLKPKPKAVFAQYKFHSTFTPTFICFWSQKLPTCHWLHTYCFDLSFSRLPPRVLPLALSRSGLPPSSVHFSAPVPSFPGLHPSLQRAAASRDASHTADAGRSGSAPQPRSLQRGGRGLLRHMASRARASGGCPPQSSPPTRPDLPPFGTSN